MSAAKRPPVRVGILGFGRIGAEIHERIRANPATGLEVAFVWARDAAKLGAVPIELRSDRLDRAALIASKPDIVVEAASGDVTRSFGHDVLRWADYLPLSVTALADDDLRTSLERVATARGTRLLIPAGALAGAHALAAVGARWRRVTFRMEKPPASIDHGSAGDRSLAIAGRTVLHDGSVRSIAAKFPRNVNAMVAGALLTTGVDAARGILVVDPGRNDLLLSVDAVGHDGSRLRVTRRQPGAGVSGTEMGASAWASLLAAVGRVGSGGVV